MGNMSGSYGSHYTLWQSITENSINTSNNTSNVTVNLYLKFDGSSYYAYTNYTTNGSMTINGNTYNYSINPITFSSGQAKDQLMASWTGDIAHNTDGTKTLNVSANWNTDTSRIGSGSCSTSKTLTPITIYSEISNVYVESTGLTSVVIRYLVSRSAHIYCSINGGVYGNPRVTHTTSGTFTITGLNPNTKYTFKILCRTADTTLDRESGVFYGTTKDIAKISALSNFEHGSNPTISITNPANISSLNLVMKIGETQILSRTIKTGSNTITFSDTELDNLYKKYGKTSSLTATFIVSGSGYANSKTCTITLKRKSKDY